MEGQNFTATFIKGLGFLIIAIGIIGGIYYGSDGDLELLNNFRVNMSVAIIFQGVILGSAFVGLSEIIKLLQNIYNQRNQMQLYPNQIQQDKMKSEEYNLLEKNAPDTQIQKPKGEHEKSQEKIYNYYSQNGIVINSVKKTPLKDIFYVNMDDDWDFVEMKDGLTPTIIDSEMIAHSQVLQFYIKDVLKKGTVK